MADELDLMGPSDGIREGATGDLQSDHSPAENLRAAPRHGADRRLDETTELLNRWSSGDDGAAEELLTRVYPDFRNLASRYRAGLSLNDQVSDLAQELYLRLADQRHTTWQSRSHFFAIAARVIRRIVADEIKHERRLKRGGPNPERVPIEAIADRVTTARPDLLALDTALEELGRVSPDAVRIVELRYFAGLSIDDTAAALGIGRATAVRRWRFARAWLKANLDTAAGE